MVKRQKPRQMIRWTVCCLVGLFGASGCVLRTLPWPPAGAVPESIDTEARVLLHRIELRALGALPEDGYRETEQSRIYIGVAGAAERGRIRLALAPGDTLKWIEGRAVNPGALVTKGGWTRLGPGDVTYVVFPDGDRLAVLDVPGVGPGKVLEVAWQVERPGAPLPHLILDDVVPVDRVEVTLAAPASWVVEGVTVQAGTVTPVEPVVLGRARHLVFEDLPARPSAQYEATLEPALGLYLAAGLGGPPTWAGVAGQAAALLELSNRLQAPSVPGPHDPESIAALVHTRLNAVASPRYRLTRPQRATTTWGRREGSADDGAWLALALLAAGGHTVCPVLVSSRARGTFAEGAPTLDAFDRLVVGLVEAKGVRLIDPVSGLAAGALPWALSGRPALALGCGQAPAPLTTPPFTAERQVEVVTWSVGPDSLTLAASLEGDLARGWGDVLEDSGTARLSRRVEGRWISTHRSGVVRDAEIASDGASVTIRAAVDLPRLWLSTRTNRIFSVGRLLPFPSRVTRSVHRTHPLDLGPPGDTRWTVRLTGVKGTVRLPEARSVENRAGRHDFTARRDGDAVELQIDLRWDVGDADPELAEAVDALIDAVRKTARAMVIVEVDP